MAISDFITTIRNSDQLDSLLSIFKANPDKEIGQAGVAVLLGVFQSDGKYDADEKVMFENLLSGSPFFKIFEKHQKILVEKKNDLTREFSFGVEHGIECCVDEVRDIRGYDESVKVALVRMAMLAGGVGGLAEVEKDFLRQVVAALGLSIDLFPKLKSAA